MYKILRSGRYEWDMEHNKIRINETAGKIIWKEERPQRSSWFVEECQIIIEDKKRAYNEMINRNTRRN
jgi:hypothetical protein